MKYIRYVNKKFLVTNDNWNTVEYADKVHETDIEEKDEDYVYVAKLRYELKEPKASIILKEMEKIKKEYKKYCNEKKSFGDALEVFAISVIHKLNYCECLKNHIVIGDYDGKVDAIFFADNKNIVYQIKNTIIGDEDLDIAKKHINQFIEEDKITDIVKGKETGQISKHLLDFCKKHSDDLKKRPSEYWSISTNRTRNNYKPQDIYNMFFSNALNYGPKPDSNVILKLKRKYRKNDQGADEENYANIGNDFFMFVSAYELIKQLDLDVNNKLSLEKLFGYNVRKYMGKDDSIQATISNDPQRFVLYNNGISIIGSAKPIGDNFVISKPYFVNGQQTIMNLADSAKKGIDISGITLPVFVKNVSDEKDILAIAKYNNTQKPIKPIDLLSLDENIRIIQDEIFKNTFSDDPMTSYSLNIYTSGKKDNVSLRNKLVSKNNQISLVDFLRCYSCVDNPDNMGEWKNNSTALIKKEYETTTLFDVEKSLKVCKAISIRKKMSDSDSIYTYSSVAVEYLLFKLNYDEALVKSIIGEYLDQYYNSLANKPKNIADIFKTPKAYERVSQICMSKYSITI